MNPVPYRVVVGVSPTSSSPTALRWAQAEAAAHGGVAVAVRAFKMPSAPAAPGGKLATTALDVDQMYEDAKLQLLADVESVLGADHGMECRLVVGGRRRVLLEAAQDANALVVDARRRTDLATGPGFLPRLLAAAPCPVVVMPVRISGEPETPLSKMGRRVGGALARSAASAGRPGIGHPYTPEDQDRAAEQYRAEDQEIAEN